MLMIPAYVVLLMVMASNTGVQNVVPNCVAVVTVDHIVQYYRMMWNNSNIDLSLMNMMMRMVVAAVAMLLLIYSHNGVGDFY